MHRCLKPIKEATSTENMLMLWQTASESIAPIWQSLFKGTPLLNFNPNPSTCWQDLLQCDTHHLETPCPGTAALQHHFTQPQVSSEVPQTVPRHRSLVCSPFASGQHRVSLVFLAHHQVFCPKSLHHAAWTSFPPRGISG